MEQPSENRRLFVRKYQFAWGNVRKRSSNRHDQALTLGSSTHQFMIRSMLAMTTPRTPYTIVRASRQYHSLLARNSFKSAHLSLKDSMSCFATVMSCSST